MYTKKDIEQINVSSDTVRAAQSQMHQNQTQIYSQLAEISKWSKKAFDIALETYQKNSKGNFIVTGESIPKFSPNEDLYSKVFPIIFKKYAIHVHHDELKVLHRLPNNKVLFSLYSRLPGQVFERFTRAMNSNPKAEIKVYVSIQLFEPFSEIYYIARRLKYFNVITNYRLDENGATHIALNLFNDIGFHRLEKK